LVAILLYLQPESSKKNDMVVSFGEALLVLTREAELAGHDFYLDALAGSNWSSLSEHLRDSAKACQPMDGDVREGRRKGSETQQDGTAKRIA
jgi:hypothetical protein